MLIFQIKIKQLNVNHSFFPFFYIEKQYIPKNSVISFITEAKNIKIKIICKIAADEKM